MPTGRTRSNTAGSPPHHHGEHAVDRPRLAAGHRRIDEAQAPAGRDRVQFARDLCRRRGVVDEHRTRLHAGECAVLAEHDRAQVVVVAHAAEHDVGVVRSLPRRGRRCAAVLGGPLVRLGRRAVEDRDVVACAPEVAGHRIPHHAEPEEGDRPARHSAKSSISSPDGRRPASAARTQDCSSIAIWERAAAQPPL
jgi:hypothetical protein